MNPPSKSPAELLQENAELRARLEKAEESLRAIRAGEGVAVVAGQEVDALKGAEAPYRLLIESMNEGAATLAPDGTILYCNSRFAEMVATPAERVIGSNLWQFVVCEQQPVVRSLVTTAQQAGARAELTFSDPAGPGLPVLLSLRPMHKDSDIIGVAVADLRERMAHEEGLRQLNQQLEERVRQRTAELQAIFDTAPIGLAIAEDLQCLHIRGNPANERMLGIGSGEELSLGAPQLARFRPLQDGRDLPVEQLPMQRAVRGETVTGQILNIVRPDGQTITLYSNAAPLLDEQGRPRGAVGAFLDITVLKQAEETLRESEARYRALFERMTEGFALHEIITDERGEPCDYRFLEANPAFERLTGLPPGSLIGKRVREVMPAIEASWIRNYGQVALTGEPTQFEDFSSALNRWYEVLAYRPAPSQFAVIFTDITARKQGERELFNAKQRLEALMRAVPVGVSFSDDPTCQRITGNPAVLAQFEVGAADNLSASAPDPVAPGRQVRFFRDGQPITDAELPLQRAVAENREVAPMELEVLLPSGRRWFAQASGAPIRDPQGKLVGGVAVTVDITALKRMEEEDRRRAEELRATNEELTRFNEAMVGRELRMIELKQEINALCAQLGQPPRYETQLDNEASPGKS